MKTESSRISKLFGDLYSGQPWIDVNIRQTLESVSAETAARKIRPDVNSIWEIVNHMISWRRAVVKRMNGEKFSAPSNNFFETVNDTSPAAWEKTLSQVAESQHEWVSFLEKLQDEDLDGFHDDKSNLTRYEIIQGIVQHDAYHLGQIKLLVRIFSESR